MTTTLEVNELIGVAPNSDFEMANIVESGLPVDTLTMLKEQGLTFTEISDYVISPRTLKHRKARGEHLSHEETDRLVRWRA